MGLIATKLAGTILLPPMNLLIIAVVGLLLIPFRQRLGATIVAVALVGLYAICTPVVGTALIGLVESRKLPDEAALRRAQVIVILGGGTYPEAPEYGGDTAGTATLERLRWGARLHHITGLPILVSGGNPRGHATSEAAQMKAALTDDFRAPAKWIEEKSNNTIESARYTREILKAEKIDRIALVTHASHMRRARLVFESAGFQVTAAPTRFSSHGPPGILSFFPTAEGLDSSYTFFYEAIGLGWYHARLAAGDAE